MAGMEVFYVAGYLIASHVWRSTRFDSRSILFLIYINDISNSTELNLLSFADDTTIYCSETTLDENRKKATSELSKILDWLHANRLSLNINNFFFYHIRSPM